MLILNLAFLRQTPFLLETIKIVDLEKKPEIKQSFGGVSVVRETKSADLRVRRPASQFGEQRMLLPFLRAEIATVNLFAEETALGST